MNASDEDLAREAQMGSLECFEELVRRYDSRLFRFLSRTSRNEHDGADLTQETLVSAYTQLASYRPSQSFATWIFAIARRKAIDHWRSRQRADIASEVEAVIEENPAALMALDEDRADLWCQVRTHLSETQFQVVWLHYVEDLKIEQISQVLGRTQTHVKVILFRARRILADKLNVPSEP